MTSTNAAVAAAAQRVDRPRDQLLAGAVLAVDQHAAVGRRRHRHLLAQLPHGVALADHRLVAIDARPQRAVLGFEPALPQRVADDEHRLLERQRLLDEVERAQLDRRAPPTRCCRDPEISTTCASTCRSRSRASVARPSMPGSQTSSTIEIDGAARDALEARLAARHRFDGVALVAQHAAQRGAHARLVVDDQDGGFHDVYRRAPRLQIFACSRPRDSCLQHGSSMVNRVPRGMLSPTSMLPPCSAMMRRTIARPRPLPRRLVE